MVDLDRHIDHARRFGTGMVLETFMRHRSAAFERHRELCAALPRPVELTWLPERERVLVLEERGRLFADYGRSYASEVADCSRELAVLRAELDELDRGNGATGAAAGVDRATGRTFTVGKPRRRRLNCEAAVMARALRERGLVTSEIAAKLGVSFGHAQRLLASNTRANPANPRFQGADLQGFSMHEPSSPGGRQGGAR